MNNIPGNEIFLTLILFPLFLFFSEKLIKFIISSQPQNDRLKLTRYHCSSQYNVINKCTGRDKCISERYHFFVNYYLKEETCIPVLVFPTSIFFILFYLSFSSQNKDFFTIFLIFFLFTIMIMGLFTYIILKMRRDYDEAFNNGSFTIQYLKEVEEIIPEGPGITRNAIAILRFIKVITFSIFIVSISSCLSIMIKVGIGDLLILQFIGTILYALYYALVKNNNISNDEKNI